MAEITEKEKEADRMVLQLLSTAITKNAVEKQEAMNYMIANKEMTKKVYKKMFGEIFYDKNNR